MPAGWNSPCTTRPAAASRCRAPSVTAAPRPRRAATAVVVNGPWVRAYRARRSPSGSLTGSVNASGTPTGSAVPSASRSRPASSIAAQWSAPPIRTAMARRAWARAFGQAGSAPRSASSAVVSGPSSRSRSATDSASLARRSSVSHWSSRSSSSSTSASSSSRSSAWPSSSASRRESRESAAARRSASGESPSYRNWATYPKSSDRAKGDGSGVVTSTRRTRRASMSPISSVRPGTSKTSWRHSRTASSTIGNEPNSEATWSSWEARWRCCHSGVRLPGLRRGSSRARAAHSRNREANRAEPPTCSVTIRLISPWSKATSAAPSGACSSSNSKAWEAAGSWSSRSMESRSASGSRSTIPSSACMTCASMPYFSARRAPRASAQGACTWAPNGEWTTTRQSPSSSRNRSTTMVRSSGTWPQASRCSARYARTFSAAQASRPAASRRSRASSSGSPPSSRRNAPTARPSSSGRPSWSPFQNGSRPGTPGAGETRTRSRVMSSIRQEVVPRVNTSPTRDS